MSSGTCVINKCDVPTLWQVCVCRVLRARVFYDPTVGPKPFVSFQTSEVSKQACAVFADTPVGPKPVDLFMDVRGPAGGEAATPVGLRTSQASRFA